MPPDINSYLPFLVLSVICGILVGAAEIIARYKDEPFSATISFPGITYMLINGLISGLAYGVLAAYSDKIFVGLANQPLLMSFTAGFGAMLVFRSKLFNLKTEKGENYSVGLDAVISTFLISTDRQIDRNRSIKRQSIVYEQAIKVRDPMGAPAFLRVSLGAYQNLSIAEKELLDRDMQEILKRDDLTPDLKLIALCFGLLNISGEKNFRQLMKHLETYQSNETSTRHQT